MRKTLTGFLLLGAGISVAQSASIERAANPPRVAPAAPTLLTAHGIQLAAPDLIRFLATGYPAGTDKSKLPDKPAERTQLAVDAMARLAELKSRDAVPILIQVAGLELPA